MEIPAGKIAGISGKTGTGKSTLLDILYGLRFHNSGKVLFNNIDSRYFFLPNMRAHVSLSRGKELFSGTIRENICLDRPISISQIHKILDNLGVLNLVRELPDGLETQIKNLGAPLSQGLVYCIIIARAILSGARLIIIDQLLDSIDGELRQAVLNYLRLCCDEGLFTVIISAYNTDSLKECDVVYEIKDKKIILGEGNG